MATPAAASAAVVATAPAPARSVRPSKARAPTTATKPAAPVPNGIVQLAITPWGQIEVDGRPAGLTPPLSKLELREGTHQVTVRNGDNAPFTTTVRVTPDKPVIVRHRFGS